MCQPTEKANESAVIVGASLSGLMTGIALARAGLKVTILERASSKPRSGAVLQVESGDLDRSKTAKLLRNLASGGKRSVEAWSSVQSRLRAEIEKHPEIELRYDTQVEAAHQDSSSAWIVTDKKEIFRGDMLIGADGHRSIVRKLVAPDKPNAIFAGYMIWVAIVEEKDIPKEHRPSLHAPLVDMPNGIGDFLLGSIIPATNGSRALGERRFGWAWYDNTRNDLLRRMGCVKGKMVQHSLNAPDIPEKTLVELSDQAADRWPQPWLAATLHSIETRNLIGTPVSEYIPDQLVNGRIALVGDAAHVLTPLSASGFNNSLQDAATLADCVAKSVNGNSVADALLEYESLRLKYVREAVQSGKAFSQSFGRLN